MNRAVFVGGGGEPPANISDPPAAIKNARGVDFLCTYALAQSSTSIAKTSTPLIKFDKYSPDDESTRRPCFEIRDRKVKNNSRPTDTF